MNREIHIRIEGEAFSIIVCPECVESGIQIDPRENHPDYPVIVSSCRTHRICGGEFDFLFRKDKENG